MSSTPQRALARGRARRLLVGAGCLLAMCVAAAPAQADRFDHGHRRFGLIPGNLLLSTSEYTPADITPGATQLPPGCTGSNCVTAIADGTYPTVFNNDTVDASFGVTSRVFLDELTPWGQVFNRIPVPSRDLVTSFSSKSELALNLSTNGRDVTFMGYRAPVGALDVSNSNTPGVIDPTNPVPGTDYRVVADLGRDGWFDSFTLTNAYSGNNGRAAILNNAANVIYTAGNAGNGANPQPNGVIIGAGAQILTRSFTPEWFQTPGQPTPVGSFSITQLGQKADKVGKDTNFRGLTISNNVVYYTKGSGGNGINTVYFVDTTGTACPHGVGLPQPGAQLPTSPIAYDPSLLQTEGVTPYNMCVLNGFPTTLAKTDDRVPVRDLVRESDHAVRRGRGQRRQHVLEHDRDVHGRRRPDDRRPAEVGVRLSHAGSVEPRLHAAVRAGPRAAVHHPRLSDREQPGRRAAVGAGDRRPAQHHGPCEP